MMIEETRTDGKRTTVECHDHTDAQSVKWIEELAGRKLSLNLDGTRRARVVVRILDPTADSKLILTPTPTWSDSHRNSLLGQRPT